MEEEEGAGPSRPEELACDTGHCQERPGSAVGDEHRPCTPGPCAGEGAGFVAAAG